MSEYKAPLRDMRFVLNEVFEVSSLWATLPGLAEVIDEETAAAILEEAGKITGEVIAPLNRTGDEQGCTWNNGEVIAPDGFVAAYQAFAEGGWVGHDDLDFVWLLHCASPLWLFEFNSRDNGRRL